RANASSNSESCRPLRRSRRNSATTISVTTIRNGNAFKISGARPVAFRLMTTLVSRTTIALVSSMKVEGFICLDRIGVEGLQGFPELHPVQTEKPRELSFA